jgi:hypothetical protein
LIRLNKQIISDFKQLTQVLAQKSSAHKPDVAIMIVTLSSDVAKRGKKLYFHPKTEAFNKNAPLVVYFYFIFFIEVSNSAYYGCPELWSLRYPAHIYHAVPSLGFEPTTLWLMARHPNHSQVEMNKTYIIMGCLK